METIAEKRSDQRDFKMFFKNAVIIAYMLLFLVFDLIHVDKRINRY